MTGPGPFDPAEQQQIGADQRQPDMTEPPEEQTPFVPAPVSRRIWAWMGIVYVLLAMLLVTYWIATTTLLSGITGLMLFPLLGALSAQGINNARLCRRGERGGNARVLLFTAVLMGLLALANFVMGVLQLAAALGS